MGHTILLFKINIFILIILVQIKRVGSNLHFKHFCTIKFSVAILVYKIQMYFTNTYILAICPTCNTMY